jgi:hypothetical protein
MQIECPECHHIHSLTTEEFQESDGTTFCPECSCQFDPLANLAETVAAREPFPWEKSEKKPISNSFWRLGVIAGLLLLGFQFLHFNRNDLAQNRIIRPWLLHTCKLIGCQLPTYRNTTEFAVLHSSFELQNNHYILQTAIRNEAPFPQAFPKIKLTLLSYSGTPVAHRIFHPGDYLKQDATENLIDPSDTFTIWLNIALPEAKVGGFSIEIL